MLSLTAWLLAHILLVSSVALVPAAAASPRTATEPPDSPTTGPAATGPATTSVAGADGQITLLITNAKEIARREKGAAVVTVASVFMDIDKKTQNAIAERMTASLAARGLTVAIEPATISFPSPGYSAFTMWEPSTAALVPVTLALGEYRVLKVDIQNPDEVVASQTSSMLVGVAHFVGWDLKTEVTERTAPILLQELEAQGVHAVAAW